MGKLRSNIGPLVFAQSIEAHKVVIKTYPIQGFDDAYFLPVPDKFETLSLPAALRWRSFGFSPALTAQEPGNQLTDRTNALHPFDTPVLVLRGNMIRHSDGAEVAVTLVPLGNAPTLLPSHLSYFALAETRLSATAPSRKEVWEVKRSAFRVDRFGVGSFPAARSGTISAFVDAANWEKRSAAFSLNR